jgi:hypothetical protein
MIKRLERLKNTVNKYMADIRPDWLMTCQSERKSVVSRQPSVLILLNYRQKKTTSKGTIKLVADTPIVLEISITFKQVWCFTCGTIICEFHLFSFVHLQYEDLLKFTVDTSLY